MIVITLSDILGISALLLILLALGAASAWTYIEKKRGRER